MHGRGTVRALSGRGVGRVQLSVLQTSPGCRGDTDVTDAKKPPLGRL